MGSTGERWWYIDTYKTVVAKGEQVGKASGQIKEEQLDSIKLRDLMQRWLHNETIMKPNSTERDSWD